MAWIAAGAVTTGVLTAIAVRSPTVLGMIGVIALAGWLMCKPLGRLLVFAVGSMAIFQSEVIGTAVRTAFMAVLIAGLIPSLFSLFSARTLPVNIASRYRWPICGLVSLFFLSVPFLFLNQIEINAWFRDATTYVLIAVGVIYGLDAGLHARSVVMRKVFGVIGVIGAFAYLVAWLDRRGVGLEGFSQFALSSSMIVVPVISMSFALYFGANTAKRGVWACVAVLQISMLLGAGGRSSVIFLSAQVGFVCLIMWQHKHSARRFLGLLTVSAVVFYVAIQIYVNLIGEAFLVNRFDWFQDISLQAVEDDGSGQARLRAYDIMWQEFLESPLIGNGLGHVYQSVSPTLGVNEVFTLDTPLLFLAKFGIIGTVILFVSLVSIIRISYRLTVKDSSARAQIFLMWGATAAAWIATLPSGAPTEQKGFGIGLAILMAMTISWAREDATRIANDDGSQKEPYLHHKRFGMQNGRR